MPPAVCKSTVQSPKNYLYLMTIYLISPEMLLQCNQKKSVSQKQNPTIQAGETVHFCFVFLGLVKVEVSDITYMFRGMK